MVEPLDVLELENLPLEPWEVGGELLDILSRGLYSDARDAVREYAQNGIDANASNLVVTVDGPRVVVRDDGEGMDWETLRRARRLGMSDKNSRENVGFRGIGLYAAFGMCERLEISTHQTGSPEELTLLFDFGSMRRILESDRSGDKRAGVALADLLYEYVWFSREPYPTNVRDRQFTIVTLEGVEQQYRAQLANREELYSYLLSTLPAAFPSEGYGATVNEWVQKYAGVRPVNLSLRVGAEPELAVQPRVVPQVDEPNYHWVENSLRKRVAFVWYAYSPHRRRLGSRYPEDDSFDASGFLLRLKGFTLGNHLSLKPLWPALGGGALYHHFTGEVHVVDDAGVYPNAARDGLEPGVARQNLEQDLRDYFDELNRRADLSREIVNAESKMQGFEETLEKLKRRAEDDNENGFELYRECSNHLDTLATTERQVLRLTRGRKAIRPTAPQQTSIRRLRTQMKVWSEDTSRLLEICQEKADQRRRSRTDVPTPRPQAAAIQRSVDALHNLNAAIPDAITQQVVSTLETAAQAQSVSRAVAVLDGLKAQGVQFSDELESCRRELRVSLGWSATGPVSLEEMLNEIGFTFATDREQLLVQALDQGLLQSSGGRGPKYEAALRSIGDELAQQPMLQ